MLRRVLLVCSLALCGCFAETRYSNRIKWNDDVNYDEEDGDDESEDLCSISVTDMPNHEPLLLYPDETHSDIRGFISPENSRTYILIATGDSVLLACPGTVAKPNMIKKNMRSELQVTCVSGSKFLMPDGSIENIKNLGCLRMPVATTRITNRTCGRPVSKYNITEIGFQLNGKNRFYSLAEVCWDKKLLNTYYVSTLQLPQNLDNVHKTLLSFMTGKFYKNLNVADLYDRDKQLITVKKLLQSNDLARTYLKPERELFNLIPNHLAAPEDFVFQSQRQAMYWFINSAPHWEILKRNVWSHLESDIRSFASTRDLKLKVYTGTHGTTTLTNSVGKEVPFTLTAKQQIRVPHLFWKVIVDPNTNKGVAFVVMNNPYYLDSCHNCRYKLCEDICYKLPWLKSFNAANLTRIGGNPYCCRVSELSKYVMEIPEMNVTGLLT